MDYTFAKEKHQVNVSFFWKYSASYEQVMNQISDNNNILFTW